VAVSLLGRRLLGIRSSKFNRRRWIAAVATLVERAYSPSRTAKLGEFVQRTLALAICHLVTATLCVRAHAQSSPKPLNVQAYQLMQQGRLADAERILLEVLQRWPSAKAHKNLGLLYLKVGNDERARSHLEEYLVREPNAYDRAWAEERIRECKERIAARPVEVSISSNPAGAGVFLDELPVSLGKTPAVARIAPGRHVLRLQLPGRGDVLRPIKVAAAQPLIVVVEFPIVRAEATIEVSANVPGATVQIDGAPASLGENPVKPGVHQVRVAKKGHRAWESELKVEGGERKLAFARLPIVPSESAPAPPIKAELTLQSSAPAPENRAVEILRWTMTGVAGAALVSGSILYYRAKSDESAANDLGRRDPRYSQLTASATRQIGFANAGFTSAGALGAAALSLHLYQYFTRSRGDKEEGSSGRASRPATRLLLSPLPTGALLKARLQF
jgi:hypothetical protein